MVVVSGSSVDVFYEEAHTSTIDIGLVTLSLAGRVIRSNLVIASGAGGTPPNGPKRDLFFPLFGATTSSDGRLLAVAVPVVDRAAGHPVIEVWRSGDGGGSWSGPTELASGAAAQLTQLQPQLGVVGNQLVASFFTESRDGVYSEWFTSASGLTARFGAPRLVSTARFHASGWIGDYQALATTNDTVHLAWNDGRTGRLQIYSATLTTL